MNNNKIRDKAKSDHLNNTPNIVEVDIELEKLIEKTLKGDKQASAQLLERRKNKPVESKSSITYMYISDPAIIRKYETQFSTSPLFHKLIIGDKYPDGTAVVDGTVLLSLSST